tara:strand:- start:95350 stop:96414 length:1065 start_codon:yes stop_codon:yes gene_type:complete
MYGILSDSHNHNWSAFAKTEADGVNSRNRIILNETIRAAQAVKVAGGDTLIHAGDLFHVRGNIAPSVLNPVLETYRTIRDMGIQVRMIPGNHDMEDKDSGVMTNAVEALRGVGVDVCNHTNIISDGKVNVVMIPWHSSTDSLIEEIERTVLSIAESGESHSEYDLIIHAPVDGVIMNIPDHGLNATQLAAFGFNRVFSGHYHSHKNFGNDVYSVGATTHQTWNDVGTKAGFLLVSPKNVKHCESHAPSFVDLTEDIDEDDVEQLVAGNYVRVTIEVEKESEVKTLRKFLIDSGAEGVVINAVKKAATVSRTGSTVSSSRSMAASISEFIKDKKYKRQKALNTMCDEIMSEVEEV